ncbi:MAG: TlpA family protein disulfide reductase [Caldilineaceae bacterium]|nr:TlpA family protein disulfide reductase [Caldilineaceae bacterium]HRJ40475.1 TlpA disulfide reductase family protein [Caldilineaceae bacterium]
MTDMTEPLSVPLPDTLAEAAPASRAVLIWRAIFILIPLVFIVFLALRLGTAKSEHRAEGLAPVLEFTTFEGETINLDNLRGQGVMVNFWASWCDPCREEAALLESTWRREKDRGIIFLGLDYLDQEPAAKAYLAEYDITYPNGPDLRSQVARRYGIQGVPETFFIDPEGKIVDIIVGPITSQAQMDGYLDKIRPKEK